MEQTFNDYVNQTIESGVNPLEVRFYPVIGLESGYPIAYRSSLLIHSVVLGEMEESFYTKTSDKREIKVELLKHNLRHVKNAIDEFSKAKRHIKYISLRCPSEIVESADLFEIMSEFLKANPSLSASKICLEFPLEILKKDEQKAKIAILDMKVLKIRTAVLGGGSSEFLLPKLIQIPVDTVILSKESTAYAGDRNKPDYLSSLISYVRSMGAEVVAEGTEEQRKILRNADLSGYIIADDKSLSLDEALKMEEEEA